MISDNDIQSHTMYNVIASAFFQKKFCRLPGIGSLEMVTTPAEYNFSERKIIAPQQKIVFTPASSSDHTFNEFSAISQLMKERLNNEGLVEITGLGSFTKDGGVVQFKAAEVPADFFQPVAAEKVIHKDSEHSILVGDKETTNVEMNEYYTEDSDLSKDRWWLWAILLAATGAALIGYYIYRHGLNNLANQAL